jgi:SAM-dependent methyltransferase
MKFIPCDICGDHNYRILYLTKDRYFPIKGTFQLVGCQNCGLLFLNPQPEAEELQRHYPTEGYYAYRSGEKATSIVNREKLNLFRAIRTALVWPLSTILPSLRSEIGKEMAYLGPVHSGIRVLDVGCGSGDILSFYRERGASTFGVEINTQACEEGRKKGHKMFCGELSEAGFEDEFFDIVLFHQSLEHVFSPRFTLLEAQRILKRGGKVWISIPNHNSVQARLFGKWFYAIESPRHLFGFTPTTAVLLLIQTRFQVEHLHTYSLPGGPCFSFEYFLNDRFNRRNPFYYGQIRVKWWYIVAEPLFFFPRLLANLFHLGEILVISGRKP